MNNFNLRSVLKNQEIKGFGFWFLATDLLGITKMYLFVTIINPPIYRYISVCVYLCMYTYVRVVGVWVIYIYTEVRDRNTGTRSVDL